MKYKVTKEWFVARIEDIGRELDAFDKMADNEFVPEAFLDRCGKAIDVAVNMLVDIAEDGNQDESWTLYWLFELERGKRASDGSVTDKDGRVVKLDTPSDLWEVIREERRAKKAKEAASVENHED